MQTTLIDQGINLMLFGMGTVFLFLTILVFATLFMSRVVQRFTPEQLGTEATTANRPDLPAPHIVEAIQQAIAQHRKNP